MDEKISISTGRAIQTKYEGSHKKLMAIAFCALFGGLNFGLSIGYSSPSIPSMIKRGVLKKEDSGWFGSLLTIGALMGAPLGGWLLENLGRKKSLTCLSVPFSLGYIVISFASNPVQCNLGRFLTGLGSGMVTCCVPMYIAEISTISMRGILGSCVQLSITIGIALAYILGSFLEWRSLSDFCIVPCILGGILSLFIPETPRYLLMKNRKPEAIKALSRLRDPHTNVNEECREIEESSGPEESVSFSEMLKRRELFQPLILVIAIMIFQQLSGINAVMFYTVSIFESAVGDFAYTATIIIGIVQIFATMAAVYLVDRAGRKKLLHVGGIVMSANLFLFGLYYKLAASNLLGETMKIWMPVFCLTIYILGFSLGWGPVPMLIMSEMIPTRCKGTAGSMAIVASWGSAFIVTSQFTAFQELMGQDNSFYIFGFFSMIAVWFVGRYIPETKGKSLEDIEMLFAGKATILV